jgi:cell wall-associated NlpC family hydrolase
MSSASLPRRPLRRACAALVLVCVAGTWAGAPAAAEAEAPTPWTSAMAEVVVKALGLVGVPYRFGGNTPTSGLDCSGLVRYVYAHTLGFDLPRRAEEISRIGQPIDVSELRPGDLLFYNTLRRAYSHVAIYVGEGRFVHAPSRGKQVRVEDMSAGYWSARFNGARRLEAAPGSPELDPLNDLIGQLRAGATVAPQSAP